MLVLFTLIPAQLTHNDCNQSCTTPWAAKGKAHYVTLIQKSLDFTFPYSLSLDQGKIKMSLCIFLLKLTGKKIKL